MPMNMSDNHSRPKIIDMPVVLEPSFPTFTPRPLVDNLNRRTANLILVNTSPHKIIFKIVPNSTEIIYSICPEIDYLAPNGCRFIGISVNDVHQSKREHDFTYKVLALSPTESFGISAAEYWEQNLLDNNSQILQEAQFVCLEPEVETQSDSSHRKVSHGGIDSLNKAPLFTKYVKRFGPHKAIGLYEASRSDSQISSDLVTNSPVYHKRRQTPKDNISEPKTEPMIQCPCQCRNAANHYFWQEAATMRSFIYGFVFAFICSAVLALRKTNIN